MTMARAFDVGPGADLPRRRTTTSPDPLGRPPAPPGSESGSSAAVRAFLRMLRRRWPIVLVCALVAGAATYVVQSRKTPLYQATATLLFRDPGLSSEFGGGSLFQPSSDPAREAATNLKLVTSADVAVATARALGIPQAQVTHDVTAASEGNSDVVAVTATNPVPAQAARIANAYVDEFIQTRQEADRSKVLQARQLVLDQLNQLPADQRDGPQGASLRSQADRLLALAGLQTGNAERVAVAATPTSPSSPHVKKTTVLGVMLGLLVGLGIALLLDQLDRSVKDTEEVERLLRAPLLGSVPESRSIARSVGLRGPDDRLDFEPFDMLRTNLRYLNVERPIRSIVVTSALPGDGKTTVAWNLAASAARSGAAVLLIEADLRRPRMAESGDLPSHTGLSTVLAGMADADDAIVSVAGRHGSDEEPIDVLPAGPVPPNPVGLLESNAMQRLIREMELRYQLIVIDTPPVAVAADAIPLTQDVDGVLAVIRLNRTRRDELENLRHQFANVGAPLLGTVVNGAKIPRSYREAYGVRA